MANRFVDSSGVESLSVFDLDPKLGNDLQYALQQLDFRDGNLENRLVREYLTTATGDPVRKPTPLVTREVDEFYSRPKDPTTEPTQPQSVESSNQTDYSYDDVGRLIKTELVSRLYPTLDRKYGSRTEISTEYSHHPDGSSDAEEKYAFFGTPEHQAGGAWESLVISDGSTHRHYEDGRVVSEIKDVYSTLYQPIDPAESAPGVKQGNRATLLDVKAVESAPNRILITFHSEHPELGTFAVKEERKLVLHAKKAFEYDADGRLVESVESDQRGDNTTTKKTNNEYDASGQLIIREIYQNEDLIIKVSYSYDPSVQVYAGPKRKLPMMYATVEDYRDNTKIYYRSWNPSKEGPTAITEKLADDNIFDKDTSVVLID